jgi:hypothetical protein
MRKGAEMERSWKINKRWRNKGRSGASGEVFVRTMMFNDRREWSDGPKIEGNCEGGRNWR